MTIYFAIFLLFQYGLIFEVEQNHSELISINSTIDYPRFNDREVSGAIWLNSVKDDRQIYADNFRRLLIGSLDWNQYTTKFNDAYYIYIGSFNIMNNSMVISKGVSYVDPSSMNNAYDEIYANGGSLILCLQS